MPTITVYTATEIEITEPKYYLRSKDTNWAMCIMPDDPRPRTTFYNEPFGTIGLNSISEYINKSEEITEARFFELVATNYDTHLNQLEKLKIEWGLEQHTLNEDPDRATIDAERRSEENADARRERDVERGKEYQHDFNY